MIKNRSRETEIPPITEQFNHTEMRLFNTGSARHRMKPGLIQTLSNSQNLYIFHSRTVDCTVNKMITFITVSQLRTLKYINSYIQ